MSFLIWTSSPAFRCFHTQPVFPSQAGCCYLLWLRDTAESFPSAPHSELTRTGTEFLKIGKQNSEKQHKTEHDQTEPQWKAATVAMKLVKLVRLCSPVCAVPSPRSPELDATFGRVTPPLDCSEQSTLQVLGTTLRQINNSNWLSCLTIFYFLVDFFYWVPWTTKGVQTFISSKQKGNWGTH